MDIKPHLKEKNNKYINNHLLKGNTCKIVPDDINFAYEREGIIKAKVEKINNKQYLLTGRLTNQKNKAIANQKIGITLTNDCGDSFKNITKITTDRNGKFRYIYTIQKLNPKDYDFPIGDKRELFLIFTGNKNCWEVICYDHLKVN